MDFLLSTSHLLLRTTSSIDNNEHLLSTKPNSIRNKKNVCNIDYDFWRNNGHQIQPNIKAIGNNFHLDIENSGTSYKFDCDCNYNKNNNNTITPPTNYDNDNNNNNSNYNNSNEINCECISNRINIDLIETTTNTISLHIKQFVKHAKLKRTLMWKHIAIVVCYLLLLSSSPICDASKHEGNI